MRLSTRNCTFNSTQSICVEPYLPSGSHLHNFTVIVWHFNAAEGAIFNAGQAFLAHWLKSWSLSLLVRHIVAKMSWS